MVEQGHRCEFVDNKKVDGRKWPWRVDFCHYEEWHQICKDPECRHVEVTIKQRPDRELILFGNPKQCKECEKRMRANPQLHDLLKNNGFDS